ncbi:hypothetical protein Q9L42_001030 [Methylomarinum sp. Ch1-1]|uniref:Sodium/calcium exchanger membrane region domain-containing protein n=1 Tax=Methylomarinum roseum TaxID=3067653 RepID=A0AAU7NUR9_9GAMM|nr:hypothetical protein [Methylomarinum sp. Ch1-1]MDP4519162.1 hypothetical protein [Methylomarinum sp. Ch1-1]
MFEHFPTAINLLIFTGLAGIIWKAGTRLSYYVDSIAEQTELARAFLGLILLATATELPEMVTTLTASSSGNGVLALNNMFGGMMLQLAVLAIADFFVLNGTLTSFPRKPTVAIAGLLSILSLSLLLAFYVTRDMVLLVNVGVGSTIIALLYIVSMYLIRMGQNRDTWSPVDLPDRGKGGRERHNHYDNTPVRKLTVLSARSGLLILISGVLVVRVAETLAVQTGLGNSFIGVSLLAMATSMPELSTSVAAVRVKAHTMAISNIFGSNLIMTFLVFPVDVFFTKGPVLNHMDRSAAFALAAGIFMTGIYCTGLLMRPRMKVFGIGIDSLLVLASYLGSMMILFQLR